MIRMLAVSLFGAIVSTAGLVGWAQPALAQDALVAEGVEVPEARIEVRDLKRTDGDAVTLRLRLINNSDDEFAAACDMRESGSESCGHFTGAYLLDKPNKKKYLFIRDSDNACVCSDIDDVPAGKTVNLWATYPAPPADVQKLTVIVPHFEPIEGVPITGE